VRGADLTSWATDSTLNVGAARGAVWVGSPRCPVVGALAAIIDVAALCGEGCVTPITPEGAIQAAIDMRAANKAMTDFVAMKHRPS
jgi:hypothetical protein